MPLHEPVWWYEESDTWQSQVLAPFGALYGFAAATRYRFTAPYRAKVPVICVGNFTAGGTGKTPFAIEIASLVREHGREPVFLSRGYGGRLEGPVIVDAAQHTYLDVGDEPLLLCRPAPVVISRDRRKGAEFIERTFGTNAVIVMDDGLQNPSLAKDVSIALAGAKRGFGNGRCLPAGPLRAPITFQTSIIHAAAINVADHQHEADGLVSQLRGSFHGPIFHTRTVPAGDTSSLRGTRVLAFSGIANPGRFFSLVAQLGAHIAAKREFPDHHPFTDAEAAALLKAAREQGAEIVTTEKDFVRLTGGPSLLALRERTHVIAIKTHLESQDRQQLGELISHALQARGAQT